MSLVCFYNPDIKRRNLIQVKVSQTLCGKPDEIVGQTGVTGVNLLILNVNTLYMNKCFKTRLRFNKRVFLYSL